MGIPLFIVLLVCDYNLGVHMYRVLGSFSLSGEKDVLTAGVKVPSQTVIVWVGVHFGVDID